MPGTIILKPLKATLLNDHHHFLKMDPYCSISLGVQEVSSKVCKNGGKAPTWEDSLILRRNYEPYCTLQIKDKEFFKNDSTVGIAQIDLGEIERTGRLTKWYKLGNNNETAGEILIEAIFAPDSAGSFKPLPQQQSYSHLASSHKNYSQNLYPSNIYSPGKQRSLGLDRPVAETPSEEIYGYHKKDQLVTYPHISHHLSTEEYSKLHGRSMERYQPVNKVVPDQKAPPTWEGYRTPDHLMPNLEPLQPEEPESKEVEQPTGDKDEKIVDNSLKSEVKSTTSLDNLSDTKNSSTNVNSRGNSNITPLSKRRELNKEVQQSPGGISYYPGISGITYGPRPNEASYQPMYYWNTNATLAGREDLVKNQRKLSANSNENGSKNSTMGSLGNVGGSSLNAL